MYVGNRNMDALQLLENTISLSCGPAQPQERIVRECVTGVEAPNLSIGILHSPPILQSIKHVTL